MVVMVFDFFGTFKDTANCLLEEGFGHFKAIDFGKFLSSHVSELVD